MAKMKKKSKPAAKAAQKNKMAKAGRFAAAPKARAALAAGAMKAPLPASGGAHPVHALYQKYSQALRLPFLVASLIPILAAGSLAWHDGVFNPVLWATAGLAVILAHAGTNLANDYFDYRNGNYPKTKSGPTGGSFAIQSGLFAPGHVLRLAIFCFAVSLLLFGYLAVRESWMVFALGLLGVAIGFFYTAPPLQLGYRHLGELATFVGMGPVLFQTMYYAQTGAFSASGWALSTFIGLLVANILLAAQLPDIEEDRASGKRTIASVWGPGALASVFLFSTLLGGAALIFGVYALGLPVASLLGLAGTVLSLQAWTHLKEGRALPGLGGALNALQIGGVLSVVGLLLVF
ncbi:MAG: prenyltransferase [Candidatus Micrarchaeota archaeon]|nr:prenyltransferase [Candidatus Micrarchaeota archaeon]